MIERFAFARHSRESGNPVFDFHAGKSWIPAFAGMTIKDSRASGVSP